MIVGEKTRLRAIERSDIPLFLGWFNDPEVRQYLSMYLPLSEAQEEQWFERQLEDDSRHVFAIETAEGVPIGNLGLHSIDWKNRSAVCGISIGEKEYWNQGYGTDAMRTLLRFAFEELNLHRVFLHVYDFNERAIRCYEKLGFRREGRLRQSQFTEGRYVDELIMGMLREEWRAEEDAR
ncbi:MAG: GNAT family N-acetyltransferase [Chloroflexi bacterium]|nr:GNAT family N-acetyltransferase [Chloroflexota bacterium]